MVAGDREHRPPEAAQEAARVGELSFTAAVAQIPARDHELGLKPLDENRGASPDRAVVTRPEMQVRQVENARGHGRGRL